MKPKINFFKKLLKTITLLTVIISLNFSIFKNIHAEEPDQTEQTANISLMKLEIEDFSRECNTGIDEGEYEFMKRVITEKQRQLTNFITFLDQPLSTKNNVFIKQTCSPLTTASTKYDCKSKVTCNCKPQFPNITSDDPAKKKG